MAEVRKERKLEVVNALEVFKKDLPPTQWYVADILHQGASLLSGDPKVGKSFLALQLALGIGGSEDLVCGSLKVQRHGKVLYVAADDRSETRIHNRFKQLTANEEAVGNIDLIYRGDIPTIQEGLDALLDERLREEAYQLVVLDTLGAVSKIASGNVYEEQYREAIALQKLAHEHKLAFLILHHTNKERDGGDSVSRASGSHGRTGGVDSVLLLSSVGKGGGRLEAKPRDGEESWLDLSRMSNGGWEVRGSSIIVPPAETGLTIERQQVVRVLDGGPMSSQEVADELGIGHEAARKRLTRMKLDQQLTRRDDGRYALLQAAGDSPPGDAPAGNAYRA